MQQGRQDRTALLVRGGPHPVDPPTVPIVLRGAHHRRAAAAPAARRRTVPALLVAVLLAGLVGGVLLVSGTGGADGDASVVDPAGSSAAAVPGDLPLPVVDAASGDVGEVGDAGEDAGTGTVVPTDLVGQSAEIASSTLSSAGFRAVHWIHQGAGNEVVPHDTFAVVAVPAAGTAVDPDAGLYVYVTPHDFDSGRDARAGSRTSPYQVKDCGWVQHGSRDVRVTATSTDDAEPIDCIAADSTALRYLSGTARDNGDAPVDMDCDPGWRDAPARGTGGWTATCRSTGVSLFMDAR